MQCRNHFNLENCIISEMINYIEELFNFQARRYDDCIFVNTFCLRFWFIFDEFNKIIVSKKWRKEDDPEWEKLNETKREKTEENDINSFLLTLNISNYQSRYNKIRRRLGLRDPNDQIYSSRVHVRIYSRVSTESRPVQRRRA